MGLKRVELWVRALLHRDAVDEDLADEIRDHLERETDANVRRGLSTREARRRALVDFGSVERAKETHRDGRGTRWISDGVADARYALRQLSRAPTFTVAVVITLALGVGVNATVFSLVNAVLLHPVKGVRDPGRLFELGDVSSYPDYRDLRDRVPVASLAAVSERRIVAGNGQAAEHATGALVSGNFFAVTGVGVAIGRALGDGDDVTGAPPVALLADEYWRRAFNTDSNVVGRTVTVNGIPLTIVGVLAPGFRGLHLGVSPVAWMTVHAWSTIAPPAAASRSIETRMWGWLRVVGRLSPGATFAQAQAAMGTVFAAANPGMRREEVARLAEPRPAQAAALPADAHDGFVRFAAVLAAVVALVLVTACANIAGLLVARAAYREREIAARVALGAGRGRLVRQLLTESIVLTGLGGIGGVVAFAVARAYLIRMTLPGDLAAGTLILPIDGTFIAVAAALTLVTGLMTGVVPAVQSSRLDVMSSLRGAAVDRRSPRQFLRGALVTAQVAVGLALLVGTGLFVRALGRAFTVDLGFATAPLMTLEVDPGLVRLEGARAVAYVNTVSARVAATPGVTGVTWATSAPLTSDRDNSSLTIEGYEPPPGDRAMAEFSGVGPHFHEVLGIPLVAGRGFDEHDGPNARPVVVVNETFARRYLAGRNPIAMHLDIGAGNSEIIGVVRDAKYHELSERPRPYVYLPLLQETSGVGGQAVLIVRTAGRAAAGLHAIVDAARSANPAVPVYGAATMDQHLHQILAPQLAGVALLGVFSVLALVIAAVGIYGVVAYGVSQRTREIGIRVALGARRGTVLRIVVARTLAFVAVGVPVGIGIAILLGRAASGFLFGVAAADAVTLSAMTLMMLLVAVLASYVPARRALRVDPLRALRSDG